MSSSSFHDCKKRMLRIRLWRSSSNNYNRRNHNDNNWASKVALTSAFCSRWRENNQTSFTIRWSDMELFDIDSQVYVCRMFWLFAFISRKIVLFVEESSLFLSLFRPFETIWKICRLQLTVNATTCLSHAFHNLASLVKFYVQRWLYLNIK